MKKVSSTEMRSLNGGARCPGCNKNCMFGTLWAHKLLCWKYKASKIKFPGL